DPDHVGRAHPRHARRNAERARVAPERVEQALEPVELLVIEPGAAVPDVDELAVTLHGQDERADPLRPAALAERVAGDHELLTAASLHFDPRPAALPGLIEALRTFGH